MTEKTKVTPKVVPETAPNKEPNPDEYCPNQKERIVREIDPLIP